MASFLIFPRADPLLSIKSVASFFQEFSVLSSQLSAISFRFGPSAYRRLPTADCQLPFQRWLRSSKVLGSQFSAFSHQLPIRALYLPPTAHCPLLTANWPSNGGFVPDFFKGRSFVINQIGGFVFQKFAVLRTFKIMAGALSPESRERRLTTAPGRFRKMLRPADA